MKVLLTISEIIDWFTAVSSMPLCILVLFILVYSDYLTERVMVSILANQPGAFRLTKSPQLESTTQMT